MMRKMRKYYFSLTRVRAASALARALFFRGGKNPLLVNQAKAALA